MRETCSARLDDVTWLLSSGVLNHLAKMLSERNKKNSFLTNGLGLLINAFDTVARFATSSTFWAGANCGGGTILDGFLHPSRFVV